MQIKTIEWDRGRIKIIDQTKLPGEFKQIYISNINMLWQAIKLLKVRGAPALGAAAGLGVYLGIKNSKANNFASFDRELNKVVKFLASSRPTAKNLFWGLERMRALATAFRNQPVPLIKKALLDEALLIIQEDRQACRRIGKYGSSLIKNNDSILTVCNAGILATIDYGTALGVVYAAKESGKNLRVFACETRPLLQGARLTAWELKNNGINVTLLCDNMAATLMRHGKIDMVIAGADRIASNGDTANKIGTSSLAVLSKYFGIPFYIAAPSSTFDLTLKTGKDIPIEERNGGEVTDLFFKKPIAPKGIKVFNPAFDVTDNKLITAIITEIGIIRQPFKVNINKMLRK